MSFIFSKNISNITGGSTWWYLKELLKTAGWLVKSSGDGLSAFSNSGDILTVPGTGANGMDNSSAWFRIQQPSVGGVNREFVIQRPGSSSSVSIKYSYSANFTGGTPGSTTIPTATDQQTVANNQALWSTDFQFHLNIGAQNSDGFGFWMAPILNGTPNTNASGGMLFDPLAPNTYAPGDTDPYIIWVENQSSGSWNANKLSGQGPGWAYYAKGTSLETFANVAAGGWSISSGNFLFPNGAGTNPFNNREQIAPAIWCKNFTSNGLVAIKGIGTIMKWNGTLKQSGQLMSQSSTGDRICISDVNFPWDNTKVVI